MSNNSNGGNSNAKGPGNYNENHPNFNRQNKISFFIDELRKLYMKKPYDNGAIRITKNALLMLRAGDRIKALEKELGVVNANKPGASRKNRKSKKSKKQRKNRKTRRN